jgi:hypothetical protein
LLSLPVCVVVTLLKYVNVNLRQIKYQILFGSLITFLN